jgi:hypothetical protein
LAACIRADADRDVADLDPSLVDRARRNDEPRGRRSLPRRDDKRERLLVGRFRGQATRPS